MRNAIKKTNQMCFFVVIRVIISIYVYLQYFEITPPKMYAYIQHRVITYLDNNLKSNSKIAPKKWKLMDFTTSRVFLLHILTFTCFYAYLRLG